MSERKRLDRRIRVVWTVGALIPAVLLGLVAGGLAIGRIGIAAAAVGAAALLLTVLALWVPGARWRSWSYELTETELIIRFGVVIRVERWLPRTRIQHVDIVGGPIERSLGLRQLVIYTAGTREADVTVPGLPAGEAEALRDDLLSWVATVQPVVDAPPVVEPVGVDLDRADDDPLLGEDDVERASEG